MDRSVVCVLASTVQALKNCVCSHNVEWEEKHRATIAEIVADYLPSGSGIDNGTTIDLDASGAKKIVLSCGYHHMDEHGGYDGWTEHTIVAEPTFGGFSLTIKGRNRNGIKEYLGDVYHAALSEPC
jgi:hypothetical protein